MSTSSTTSPGTRRPRTAPAIDHPVVGVGVEQPAAHGRGVMRRPSSVSVTAAPQGAELAGQGGEPVGLVAADVGDAADHGGGVGQGGQGGDDRGQLAGVVEVDVDAVDLAGAATR